jgi:hypothetical protein
VGIDETTDAILRAVLDHEPRLARQSDVSLTSDVLRLGRVGADEPHLQEALIALLSGDYPAARSVARDLRLRGDEDKQFRRVVNERLLAGREREWTQHGIHRSFRFYSLDEKREYLGFVVELAEELRDLSPYVCLGFGAALAVVRDQDLIPHDDDLDLLVAFEMSDVSTLAEGIRRLAEFVGDRGYQSRTEAMFAHLHVSKPGTKPADVFVGLIEPDDTVGWFPGHRHQLHRSAMFPASYRTVLEIACPLPQDPESYLAAVYGESWRVPDPRFTHRWSNAEQYADISGAASTSDGVGSRVKAWFRRSLDRGTPR